MKFWKWLARICTAVFIAVLALAWIVNGSTATKGSTQQNEPPPVPVFR